MKRKLIVTCTLLISMLFVFNSTEAAPTSTLDVDVPSIATWWWWNDGELFNSSVVDTRLVFLENNNVTEIYLYFNADSGYTRYFSVYRDIISKANEKGIKCYALGADANWLDENGSDYYDLWFNQIVQFQASAAVNEKFIGVHFDLEPGFTNSTVETDLVTDVTLKERFVELYNYGRVFCDNNNLQFEADVPGWYDFIGRTVLYEGNRLTLGEFVAKKVDGLTIMSYHYQGEVQVRGSSDMILYAQKYNRKVVLSCETNNTEGSSEPSWITYYGEGKGANYMYGQIAEIKALMDGRYGYYGVAIHHIKAWMDMNE
jgi:hypothetical protein